MVFLKLIILNLIEIKSIHGFFISSPPLLLESLYKQCNELFLKIMSADIGIRIIGNEEELERKAISLEEGYLVGKQRCEHRFIGASTLKNAYWILGRVEIHWHLTSPLPPNFSPNTFAKSISRKVPGIGCNSNPHAFMRHWHKNEVTFG